LNKGGLLKLCTHCDESCNNTTSTRQYYVFVVQCTFPTSNNTATMLIKITTCLQVIKKSQFAGPHKNSAIYQ